MRHLLSKSINLFGYKNLRFLYPFFNKKVGLLFHDEKTDALIYVSDYVKILALYDAELNFGSHRQSYKQFCDFIPTIYSLCHIMQNTCHFTIKKITRVGITIIMLKNGTGAGRATCSRTYVRLCKIFNISYNKCSFFFVFTLMSCISCFCRQ